MNKPNVPLADSATRGVRIQKMVSGRAITDEEREELLFNRVYTKAFRSTMTIIAAAVTVLTGFGLWRIDAATKPIQDVEALKNNLRTQTDSLRDLADAARAQLSTLQMAINTNNGLMEALTGSYNGVMQAIPQVVSEAASQSAKAAESALGAGRQIEDKFEQQRLAAEERFAHVPEMVTGFNRQLAGFNKDISEMQSRVLETWNYIFREGDRPQVLRGSNTNFVLTATDVKNEQWLDLTITHQRTGTRIYTVKDLPVGEEREFYHAGKRYQIYVPWALDVGLDRNRGSGVRTDVFGFELRRLGNAPQERAPQATLRQ